MKKIIFNFSLIVFLFGGMYLIGHNVLYPINGGNDIKHFSSKYNVDPYLVASIINTDFRLSAESFKELAKEMNIKNFTVDDINKPSFRIESVAYLLSKCKSASNIDDSLNEFVNIDSSLNNTKTKIYPLTILRNKSWYKLFHYELN